MRSIKSIQDADIVVKPILDFKSRLENKHWDRHGLQIKNNADATDPGDYVTLRQLPVIPTIPPQQDQHYSIVFTTSSTVTDGMAIPCFTIGQERTGIPIRVKATCETAPISDAFINVALNPDPTGDPSKYANILQTNLKMPAGSFEVSVSSEFVIPLPRFGVNYKVKPIIVTAAGMGLVTITVIVQKIFNA